MKRILLIAATITTLVQTTYAQGVTYPAPKQPAQPQNTAFSNPHLVFNYAQNNASFVNNSTQYKPANPNAATFSGNGTYLDPSRNVAPTYNSGNTATQQTGITGTPNETYNTIFDPNKR